MKTNVFYWHLAVLCLLLLLISGCSSIPTDSDGKRVLEMKWAEEAKVVEFNRTKTEEMDLFGTHLLRMNYEAEIEYIKNVPGIVFLPGHKKGDREKVSGTLTFTKKEKGWEGEDGHMYRKPLF